MGLVLTRHANTVVTVDLPCKITKKCLQKRPQSGKVTALRVSEASEEYGTYEYFRSRTARRVSDVPTTEGGKVLPEKGKLTVEEKAKPVRKRLVINKIKVEPQLRTSSSSHDVGRVNYEPTDLP
jgi:hypothetical protein